ncbi:MAG: hypothetical protein J5758_06690, partial [Abditibacteriota bacterium]|nr:hypothetical protein [Abditibacteriota bacterium]
MFIPVIYSLCHTVPVFVSSSMMPFSANEFLISSALAQFFSARAATGFAAKVKAAVFSHVQTLSYREIDRVGTSTLITRLSSDVNTLQG